MLNIERWLYFLMEGSAVERFHARPLMEPNTVGQHSHGVAMLCWRLTNGKCTPNLLMAALAHDMAEQAVSDVAATTKRALNITEKLQRYEEAILEHFDCEFIISDGEQRVLSIADKMDGMLHCCRELFRGNRYVTLSYHKWRSWLMEADLNDTETMVLNGIERIWAAAIRGQDPMFDIFAEVSNGRSE